MFRFESVSTFQWLWLLAVIFILTLIRDRQVRKVLNSQIGARLAPFLTKSLSLKRRKIKRLLEAAVILFFIVAWARPQSGQSKQEIKSEGVEILFLVDVSDSMMAEDVKPNRLEQAKSELIRMVDLMPGNKIGVVAFAGNAGLISPLTTDPAAVKMFLESLTTQSVSSQGTNFQEAMEVAEKAFERGGAESDDVVKVTRVILIASDGEDNEPGAEKAAEELVKKGIRIYSVAYGTEKGGTIPVRDGMGYLKTYKKDHSGQTILTTVHGDALRALAKKGQGSFYFATFGGDHVHKIVDDIDQLEKKQFESSVAVQYDERFQWPLLCGVILALLELILGDRRSNFRLWRGRFEVPPA
jgi:Ca-activated chloride channel family protein